MYLYVKGCYQQWCNGLDDFDILHGSETFINLVHDQIGYEKEELREFLSHQQWFKEVRQDRIDQTE